MKDNVIKSADESVTALLLLFGKLPYYMKKGDKKTIKSSQQRR